ncbi:MAG: Nif3-like dinuclear metal center hexameric protein [Fimbriimonadaceae bacterium]|nr:Nif3-like dinuclear metal center hexameric protein [Fimbriimonadaceae bacterium]
MTTLRQVLDVLETLAPARFALPGDRIGLQIGDPEATVERAVVALDASMGLVERAVEIGAQLAVCHHPVIWDPLKTLNTADYVGAKVASLVRRGVAFVAAHTNWDAARGGINDTLASLLGLVDPGPFGSVASEERLKVTVFVPEDGVETMLDALASAGAGEIGRYRRCGFIGSGTGTYLGGEGTHPALGKPGRAERVAESRLEAVLPMARRESVERAIRAAHPYEEPALDFYRLTDLATMPLGRIGALPNPTTLRSFVSSVDRILATRSLAWGNPDATVRTVAVCGGAADDEWRAAKEAGANVLVTGEVKQHVGLEVSESDFGIVAAGHHATEHPGCAALRDRLAEAIPDVRWDLYAPDPGRSGRPFAGA